jgi:membrane protein
VGVRRPRGELPPLAERSIRALPRAFRRPAEVVARTTTDAVDDRIVGLAAEVAFFAILSLPPLLLTIVGALGFIPGDQAAEFVEALVGASDRIFTPGTVQDFIEPTIRSLVDAPRPDVVSLGFVVSLLSASRAVRVVLVAVAIAYDDDYRPTLLQRVAAVLFTLGLFIIVPIVIPLLLAGPGLGATLASNAAVPASFEDVWPLLYWTGVGILGVLVVALVYHLAAPSWTAFRRDLPGAFLAIGIWVASSAGLRLYTRNAIAGRTDEIYSILAGPLALLLWLYVLALGVLLGGELNAELERVYPSPEHRRIPPGGRMRRVWSNSGAAERANSLRDRVTSTVLDDASSTKHERPAHQHDGS